MPIYELGDEGFQALSRTTFADQNIRERQDIQRHLREHIEVIAPDSMVITEEFGDWDASRRRIDLLCLDRDANLVVVELKRTEDGGHMELQSVRYSAMISAMTFAQVVEAHRSYLELNQIEAHSEQAILEFLGWDDIDEESFAQDVRIVLASAEFSKELTTSVLWLNEKGLDIRCVKMEPYVDGERILLDIQQVIPLPETEQFQVRVRQKKQREQQSRSSGRDFSTFSGEVGGVPFTELKKRNLMYHLISAAIRDAGATPEELCELISWRRGTLFKHFDGLLDENQFAELLMQEGDGGTVARTDRYFCRAGQLFHHAGCTYGLTNQWGVKTVEAVSALADRYSDLQISYHVD